MTLKKERIGDKAWEVKERKEKNNNNKTRIRKKKKSNWIIRKTFFGIYKWWTGYSPKKI